MALQATRISRFPRHQVSGDFAFAGPHGLTGAKTVVIASAREFQDAFPDCETGAMPPFGNLYEMPVYADRGLSENVEITFSAGTHHELVRMRSDDRARLVDPTLGKLTYRHAAAA